MVDINMSNSIKAVSASKTRNKEDRLSAIDKTSERNGVSVRQIYKAIRDKKERKQKMSDEDNQNQLDELSKDTLKSYVNKATIDVADKSFMSGNKLAKKDEPTRRSGSDDLTKARKRQRHINKAVDKLAESKDLVINIMNGNLVESKGDVLDIIMEKIQDRIEDIRESIQEGTDYVDHKGNKAFTRYAGGIQTNNTKKTHNKKLNTKVWEAGVDRKSTKPETARDVIGDHTSSPRNNKIVYSDQLSKQHSKEGNILGKIFAPDRQSKKIAKKTFSESEQLDELSTKTLDSYQRKAHDSKDRAGAESARKRRALDDIKNVAKASVSPDYKGSSLHNAKASKGYIQKRDFENELDKGADKLKDLATKPEQDTIRKRGAGASLSYKALARGRAAHNKKD